MSEPDEPSTPPAGEPPLALLQFPTEYPIKVVGRNGPDFRARIDAVFASHVPDLDGTLTTERLSGNGNFLSVSYIIRAVSAAQVTALAIDLKAAPDVVIVI